MVQRDPIEKGSYYYLKSIQIKIDMFPMDFKIAGAILMKFSGN